MGKYIRVWIYEENEKLLEDSQSVGKTINNALSLYSKLDNVHLNWSRQAGKSSFIASMMSSPISKNSNFNCPNGHVLVNGKKCISKACKYGK